MLDALLCEHIANDGKAHDNSFLSFDEGLELFLAYHNIKGPQFINTDKDKFMYGLLHKQWGLCVYIVFVEILNQRFIVLRPDSCNLERFLDVICCATATSNTTTKDTIQLDAETVKGILATVDTEWDRKVACVLLADNQSRTEISQLGIDPDNIRSDTDKVSMLTIFLEYVCCCFSNTFNSTNIYLLEQCFLFLYYRFEMLLARC